MYLNLQRAEEERAQLNVEMNRLLTSLFDMHVDISVAIASCQDPPLIAELRRRLEYHQLVSERIVLSLFSSSHLPEFTGSLSVGHSIGRPPIPHSLTPPSWIHTVPSAPLAMTLPPPSCIQTDPSPPLAMKAVDPDGVDIDGLVDFFDSIEL